MGHAAKSEPVLLELVNGRRFRARPNLKAVESFIRHVASTGRPHTWPGISTTEPAQSSRPVLLKRFTIPDSFRRGPHSQAPCPICCPYYPKYGTGYLVWHPDDQRVRAIGQECGKEFFDDGAFDGAVAAYDREELESAARRYLSDTYPRLVSEMVQNWFVRTDLQLRLRKRDELVSTITLRAVAHLKRKASSDGTLYVEADSGLKDDKGRALIRDVAVVKVAGLEGLKSKDEILQRLIASSLVVGGAVCAVTDEHYDRLKQLTGAEAIHLENAVRRFLEASADAARANIALEAFLAPENLLNLGRYGSHRDCPAPFWIALHEGEIFAGKGVKPARMSGQRRVNL